MAEREIIMTPKVNTITMHEAIIVITEGEHIQGSKPIFCLDTGKVYASIKDCHKMTGCAMSDLSRATQGKVKTVKGHRYFAVENAGEHFELIMQRIRELHEALASKPKEIIPDDYEEYLEWKKAKEKKAELEAAKSAYAQTIREIEAKNIALEELDTLIRTLEAEV